MQSDNCHQTPLGQFITTHRKGEKGECTLTGMASLKGNFTISTEEYPQFLDLLHDYLFVQHRRPLNLVEQRRADLCAPILIDLDFKYPTEHAIQRQFELSHIYAFTQKYVEQITHFYSLNKPIRFFISLRPAPYEDKKAAQRSIKDGIHIQCPDLILHSEHQQVLRHRALSEGILAQAFKGTEFINSEQDVFDEAIVKKNGWFFYGESKPDIPAYQLASVYVYNPITKEFYIEDHEYGTRQLIELLSIRHNLSTDAFPVEEKIQEEWQTRLDLCTGKRTTIVNQQGQFPVVPIIQLTSSNVQEQLHLDKIELAKELTMQCLSVERATAYKTWLEVGMCLHNIDSSEEMFDTWMEFSAKSAKASVNKRAELFRNWTKWARNHSEHKLTERSLHMWARNDNPDKYRQITKNSFVNFVESEVDLTHTHIARLMKRMYGNDYCASVDSKRVEWYHFNGTYWKKIPQGIELRNKITTEVAEVISDTRSSIRSRMLRNTLTDAQREHEEARMKKFFKIEESLYQSGFKDSVMKECIGIFYEEDFALKLNANQYLIGFANGVLDLRVPIDPTNLSAGYTVEFRKAEPTDFITFMAGRYQTKNCDPIDYIEYDPYDQEQADIHAKLDDFMEKLFPKPELRTYMWRKLASCLEGANKEQTYETWIGVGGNGKSKLVDLMSMVLGDYASSLQSTAMTRKRPESGAANPDIMAIRNKRFIYMAEPDDKEPLNTSRMKQFTGEDDVEARGLFEEQTKFKITGKIFMLCNAFPAINTMDRGTWRRVRAVPFESKFVDTSAEEINPDAHIYPRDPNLDTNMFLWRSHFMSRLVHIYKTEYQPNGLGQVPAIVTQESNKYQESFDSVGKFMNARIREVKKGGYEADIKDLFRSYKSWYEAIGGGVGRKLSQPELYKRLTDKCGEPADKKTFKLMRVFQHDEDVEEYDLSLKSDVS